MPRMLLALAVVLVVLAGPGSPPAGAQAPDYLALTRAGVARAQAAWRDSRDHWYFERLDDRARYPQATIWGAVPLFEALDALALASPGPRGRAAVNRFARGAERYFDRGLAPGGGFAPYPGDRGPAETWFDDNGWWGLAFVDAYRATGQRRYLTDAARALRYAVTAGWDPAGGGLWWNTSHPFKAGEANASNALLGARLYGITRRPFFLAQARRILSWADAGLWVPEDRLYARSNSDPTPMPYVEGPMIEAHRTLCEATGERSECARAATLANRAFERFANLGMGPQYDTIYLREMLAYGRATGDRRWRALAESWAAQALANARDSSGLFLRAWDGTDMRAHQADPGMLRTDAATVELFGWLAATPGA